jgi:LPXTG-motif cell wall-anchored protein
MDSTGRTGGGTARTKKQSTLAALAGLAAGLLVISSTSVAYAGDDDGKDEDKDNKTGQSAPPDDGGGGNGGGHTPVTLCHVKGNGGFVQITIDDDGLNGHSHHDGDIIPAPAGGCPAPAPAPENDAPKAPKGNEASQAPVAEQAPAAPAGKPNNDKVRVCHITGNGGFVVIEIARAGWDNGHSRHVGDILLTEAAATCPVAAGPAVEPAAPAAETPKDKVTICHITGNGGWVMITIAQAGWDNGHSKHEGDFIVTDPTIPCAQPAAIPAAGSTNTDNNTNTNTTTTTSTSTSTTITNDTNTNTNTNNTNTETTNINNTGVAGGGTGSAPGGSPSGVLSESLTPVPVGSRVPAATPPRANGGAAVSASAATPGAAVFAPAAPAAQADGDLPETGSDSGMLLTLGALAALAGLVFLGLGRRRATR